MWATLSGFVLALLLVIFTSQGRELLSGVRNYLATGRKGLGRAPSKGGPLFDGDHSRFVRDVNYPDGSIVTPGQRFRKIWEIRNTGSAVWEDRHLVRVGSSSGPGLIQSEDRVKLPYTKPGESCRAAIDLVAPDLPGTTYAEWKMVDASGEKVFPDLAGVFITVVVAADN